MNSWKLTFVGHKENPHFCCPSIFSRVGWSQLLLNRFIFPRYHSSPELLALTSFKRWWKTLSTQSSRRGHTGERTTGLTTGRSTTATTMTSWKSGNKCSSCSTKEGCLTTVLLTTWGLTRFWSTNNLHAWEHNLRRAPPPSASEEGRRRGGWRHYIRDFSPANDSSVVEWVANTINEGVKGFMRDTRWVQIIMWSVKSN